MEIPKTDSLESTGLTRIDVPPMGDPKAARFMFVGEAPGKVEMDCGQPFQGPAGNIHKRLTTVVGIPNFEQYIVNCVDTKLKNNNANLIYKGNWRCPEWYELQQRLIKRIEEFSGNVVICYGQTPIMFLGESLTTKTVAAQAGGCYDLGDLGFPTLKGKSVIFTYHPASALPSNQPRNYYIIQRSLYKAIELDELGKIPEERIDARIRPSFNDVLEFLGGITQETSFDIEANESFCTCIAFTQDDYHKVMSIPFWESGKHYWSAEQEVQVWDAVARVLESPDIRKIAQNAMFDVHYLWSRMGITTRGLYFDTMLAHHLAWAELPKNLGFLVGFYLYHPYHKDEGKNWHTVGQGDYEQYWLYNAKDAAYTHELVVPLQEQLESLMAEPTMRHLIELHEPLLEMQHRGIRVDEQAKASARLELLRVIEGLEGDLEKVVGHTINANSPKQVKEYFYDELKLKPYVSKKGASKGNATVDANALTKLAHKGYEAAKIIINIRRAKKLLGTYFNMELSADGRMRTSFNISGTETGRLSSSEDVFGEGTNLQNIPKHAPIGSIVEEFTKKFRYLFIPDEGYWFCEVDLEQAEARPVAYMSGDEKMIASFESHIDVHTYNASEIFHKAMEDVTKQERQLGKKIVHASNYDMGPYTLMDQCAKELDLWLEFGETKRLLAAYHNRFPGVRNMHRMVRNQLNQNRTLYNLWGRPRRFLRNLDDHTFKSAYAYIPQSTVAETLNRGLVRFYQDSRLRHIPIISTVHDSVLFLIPKSYDCEEIYQHFKWISECMTFTLTTNGKEFDIPCAFAIGASWGGMREVKKLTAANIAEAIGA